MDEENGIKLPPILLVNPFVFRGGTRVSQKNKIVAIISAPIIFKSIAVGELPKKNLRQIGAS